MQASLEIRQPRLAGVRTMSTDTALLKRYVQSRDEDAFRAIVERHAGMVYATCRRVLGEPSAAEDAGQAVFLLLVKKAPMLGAGTTLAGWLYRTAEFTAREARRNRTIRQRHEKEAGAMRGTSPQAEAPRSAEGEAAWEQVRPCLDEALAALPAAQREALVLRYLEGRSFEEAARELRCPVGTLSARVSRALEKLRAKLQRRDVQLSAALLVSVLGERAIEAAPAHFAGSVQAACLGTAGASAGVLSLVEAVMNAMFWMKVKLALAAACVAVALGAGLPAAYVLARAEEQPAQIPAQEDVSKRENGPVPEAITGAKNAVPPSVSVEKRSTGAVEVKLKMGGDPAGVFKFGEPVLFEVVLTYSGAKPLVKFIEPSPGTWRVVFTPLDGGRPRLAERNTADPGPTVIGGDFGPWAPLALKQGKEQSIAFKIDKRYWFVEARDKADKKVEPLLHLPSGIYSVTVSHSLGDWKSKIPDAWNDPVTTDTVQVEITR